MKNFDFLPQKPRSAATAILLRAVANRQKALKEIDRANSLCGPVRTYDKDGNLIRTEAAKTMKQVGRALYRANGGYSPHRVSY